MKKDYYYIWSELYVNFENNTHDSPRLSATLFEPGTILKGNDDENYIVTSDTRNVNKWSLINEEKNFNPQEQIKYTFKLKHQ